MAIPFVVVDVANAELDTDSQDRSSGHEEHANRLGGAERECSDEQASDSSSDRGSGPTLLKVRPVLPQFSNWHSRMTLSFRFCTLLNMYTLSIKV